MGHPPTINSLRVLLVGGTGTAGQGAARALVTAGNAVTALVRPGSATVPGTTRIEGNATDPADLIRALTPGFDAIVSTLASRSGAPADAWRIDYQAHSDLLKAAQTAGVRHFVLLSAICVQKPKLAFQKAKLRFEAELQSSGLTYAIVRPTALFKSLSGQLERLRAGKPFLVFGDGERTACKPISDDDLGRYMARCLIDPALQNRVLPIGGPGPAMTPLEQGAALFAALGKEPRYKHVPPGLLSTIAGGLGILGKVSRSMAEKSALARIGHYYATQSMAVIDPKTGEYDPDGTPSTGSETLPEFYAKLVRGEVQIDRGEHAVF